ncbi:hypothetical protein BJ878DRAFT_483422 [Calycina marina]|uniref:PPPDE domain-containing protein n=1 Tax=Calycina marina TaxID=1763456 RepID=A0A9P7YW56_9HELO|nr:hypothetical protein BJ878DRAFT_483422 [Calycina marina]
MFNFHRKNKSTDVTQEAEPVPEEIPEAVSAGESADAAETDSQKEEKLGRRARLGGFLQQEWSKGLELGKEQLTKGVVTSKVAIQQTLGLGARPNVIPHGDPRVDGELRTVEIGWHPVPGMAFIENSGLGKRITESVGKYPDPTQHWAVLVGDFVHQLWMDGELHVIYINEKVNREEWHTFQVGKTRFTDEALRQTAEMVIHNMRQIRPAYNLINNNCQNFAVKMLDACQIGAHREFASTFAIYQRATGAGTIKDLFVDSHPEDQKTDTDTDLERPGIHRMDTVQTAQIVMDEQTAKIDNH